MDIGDGDSLELMDMFCYLDDMLNVGGDADAAVEAGVCKEWTKFRQRKCIYLPIGMFHLL